MATAMKKCKVCGKEYEYCHTLRRVAGVFRWQDVACCPEHGSIYLAKIEASRADIKTATDSKLDNTPIDYSAELIEDDEDDDDLFEDDFDEDEEDDLEDTAIIN